MGMWTSGYIFQAKSYEIIGYIEVVKTNIYNMLVLSKEISLQI